MIADVVAQLRRDFGIPVDPARRGPVPLNRFFQEMVGPRVSHRALADLTRGVVLQDLQNEGVPVEDIGDVTEPLAGFIFFSTHAAWAFVKANDALPRRRFTAAHELGHAVLHRDKLGPFIADATIDEADDRAKDYEREANQFAAELLMPKEICEARALELKNDHGCCPKVVLAYRLASELLVSGQAIAYRLKALGVGDDN